MIKTVKIDTKISAESYILLTQIAKAKGLTIYQLLQLAVEFVIRTADGQHQFTPELREAKRLFDLCDNGMERISLTGRSGEVVAEGALYLYRDFTRVRPGYIAAWQPNNLYGESNATFNIVDIFEHVIGKVYPQLAKKIREYMAVSEERTMLGAVDAVLDDALDLLELQFQQSDLRVEGVPCHNQRKRYVH